VSLLREFDERNREIFARFERVGVPRATSREAIRAQGKVPIPTIPEKHIPRHSWNISRKLSRVALWCPCEIFREIACVRFSNPADDCIPYSVDICSKGARDFEIETKSKSTVLYGQWRNKKKRLMREGERKILFRYLVPTSRIITKCENSAAVATKLTSFEQNRTPASTFAGDSRARGQRS